MPAINNRTITAHTTLEIPFDAMKNRRFEGSAGVGESIRSDPNKLDGIVQIAVKPEINLTFAVGLRSILRGDPNVIMVGEMRDLETTEIAIRGAVEPWQSPPWAGLHSWT